MQALQIAIVPDALAMGFQNEAAFRVRLVRSNTGHGLPKVPVYVAAARLETGPTRIRQRWYWPTGYAAQTVPASRSYNP
jgi:hypothetical protein